MSSEQGVGGGRNDEFKAATEYNEINAEALQGTELPTKIEKSDIKAHAINVEETEIVLQRHGAYIRDRKDPGAGSLSDPELEKTAASAYFESFLAQLPEAERDKVDVLFVASDTQYFDGGRRSYETASLAQEAAAEVFAAHGLSEAQIVNTAGRLKGEGGPKPLIKLREPNMLNESPDFLDYMLGKYGGINLEFWVAFEEDREKETRLAMGAEGPDDIADRLGFSVRVMARYAKLYHQANPDRRLIIWAGTHYDTITQFVKRDVFGIGKEAQLLVDYGGGIAIDIDKAGHAQTELGGRVWPVSLERPAKEA